MSEMPNSQTGCASAASSSPPSSHSAASSFLRLAVVERQLIMQGLDLLSLARLASTCKRMREEAMDKEAGKFIPMWHSEMRLSSAHHIRQLHPAHASPLFCQHAAMSLWCYGGDTPNDYPPLIHKATQFSRVVSFTANHSDWWTEERMLELLSLPCLQHVTELNLSESLRWIDAAHRRFSRSEMTETSRPR